MATALSFVRVANPAAATADHLAEVLSNPGFGRYFTDHMVTIRWSKDAGWHSATVGPYRQLELDPAAMVFHYGQAIFEGLKAFRQPDGSVASFRPEANAERFRNSARRIAMAELPDELFMAALHELIAVDNRWVPAVDDKSLYLRPFMIATETGLGVRPAAEYLFVLIASPAGSYFSGGLAPVTVWLSDDYVRAAPGGTGAAKFGGNYAASLIAQAQAAAQGCDQVVWLDAVHRRWVEEMGGMNLFFVFGSGDQARIMTPGLSGTLLPGVIRRSLLTLASDLGYQVSEGKISTEEWEQKAKTGELTEVFACGTAAVITPVGKVMHRNGEFRIADGNTGKITVELRERLTAIQRGTAPDRYGWMTPLG